MILDTKIEKKPPPPLDPKPPSDGGSQLPKVIIELEETIEKEKKEIDDVKLDTHIIAGDGLFDSSIRFAKSFVWGEQQADRGPTLLSLAIDHIYKDVYRLSAR